MTFEVAAEAERVLVADPGDVVCEAKRLLLALVKRVVWSAEGKLRHVGSGAADEVAKPPGAGAIIEEERRIGDSESLTGEPLREKRIVKTARVVQIEKAEPRLINQRRSKNVLIGDSEGPVLIG